VPVATACHTTREFWDGVVFDEELHRFYTAGRPLRALVLGDARVSLFAYTNTFTGSRAFDTCLVKAASALGITNIDSATGALDIFRQKLATVSATEYDAVVVMLGAVDVTCSIWRRASKLGTGLHEQLRQAADNLFTFLEEVAAVFPAERIVVVGAVSHSGRFSGREALPLPLTCDV
jgi:hypothetical protein